MEWTTYRRKNWSYFKSYCVANERRNLTPLAKVSMTPEGSVHKGGGAVCRYAEAVRNRRDEGR